MIFNIIIVGLLIGGLIIYLMHISTPSKNKKLPSTTVQLKEEKLNISKERVQTGEVSLHKEIIRDIKNIAVPVKREELVIQKKTLNPKSHDENASTETIRIPLSKEKIEITKHPKPLNDVSVYKNKSVKNHRVEETLKKEKVKIKSTGDPVIIYNSPDDQK